MDIGLLVAQTKINQPKIAQGAQAKRHEQTTTFDKVFNKAIQDPAEKQLVKQVETDSAGSVKEGKVDLAAPVTEGKASLPGAGEVQEANLTESVEEVVNILETEDLKSLLELLGMEVDDSLTFVQINDDVVPVEELMNLEGLTALLNMTPKELQEIVAQLLDNESELKDVWAILEQAPALLAQVAAVLQGEPSNVTPREATKVVEFLKLAQVIGARTDTVYQQDFQLKETKASLQTILSQLVVTQGKSAETAGNFQKVFQTIQSGEQKSTKSEIAPSTVLSAAQTSQVPTRTITVTLPANPAMQSEALIKELEQAISRTQLFNSQGQIKLLLKLYPENLGQIRVELFQKDGIMQARILASTSQAKELLDTNIHQLKTALTGQNIQMDRIDIAQSLQSTDQQLRDQSFLNNFFGQQQEEVEEQKQEDEEETSFEELLQQQIINEEV